MKIDYLNLYNNFIQLTTNKFLYKDLDKQDIFVGDSVQHYSSDAVICGFLGGGNYASRILIPAFKKSGAQMETLVTSRGINSSIQGKKNGFNIASTSESSVINSGKINTVVIATQHNLHALQVIEALKKQKNV